MSEADKVPIYGVLVFFGLIILITVLLAGALIIKSIGNKISEIKYNQRRKRFKVVK